MVKKVYRGQNKQFLRKCTVSFVYLWLSSGVFRSVGITGISLQASVSRLHAAFIDFTPLLLKCTINQYSNKSSFILEKCSFQLSGHGAVVLSGRPWRQRSAPGQPNKQVRDRVPHRVMRQQENTQCNTQVVRSMAGAGFVSRGPYIDVYIVFSPSLWCMRTIHGKTSRGFYERVFTQGLTLNVKQKPKVCSIHHITATVLMPCS